MSTHAKKFRKELTPQFLEAAKVAPESVLENLLAATEYVRDRILMPSAKHRDDIAVERKDTGGQRESDAKTFSIKTDKECEATMETMLHIKYPEALLISEEKYGAASLAEKRAVLEEALTTDRMVILTDPLDATRDFRNGGDGYGTMVCALQNGKVTAAVAYRSTDYADLDGHGHTLTFETGDVPRIDGKALVPLSERTFPTDPVKLRGYAGFEFIEPLHRQAGAPETGFPDLTGKFDGISDLWTCPKLYSDLLTGTHHFMLVPPPTDIFDYPVGISLIQQAGGVVRYLDGAEATFDEIVRRQDLTGDDADKRSINNTLVFAVSEDVFTAVQKTVYETAGLPVPAAASTTKTKPRRGPSV